MDMYEKLKGLKELFDKGLLNEDEFSKLKSEILFGSKIEAQSINESNKTNKQQSKEELNKAFSNGEISGYQYNELSNELAEKSNNNSNEDHSVRFLLITLVVAGVLFFTFSIKKSNAQNNSAVQDTLSTTTSAPIINNTIEKTNTTCKICGRTFSGDGYDKIDGVWQRTSRLQTELCSQNCAIIDDQRQNQKYNAILQKHGYAPIDFDSKTSNSGHAQPNKNGYFTDDNGQLHQASPCGYCHHTGYIDMGDGMQLCPMCNGRGEIIH